MLSGVRISLKSGPVVTMVSADKHRHHRRTEQKGYRHIISQPLLISRPKCLGYHYAESAGNSVAETDDEKHHGPGCAHGRQRLLPNKLSYDDGIHHVIKLLKDVSDQQWNGKCQNQLQRLPCVISFVIIIYSLVFCNS